MTVERGAPKFVELCVLVISPDLSLWFITPSFTMVISAIFHYGYNYQKPKRDIVVTV